MPNEIDNKGGEAVGDDAAAKAVADKATADAAAAAAAGSGNGAGAGEETVASLKEKLTKAEEDRDHYKKGLLAKKADERDLHAGGDGKGAGEGAGSGTIDEKKIAETAAAATNKTLRAASERTAKRSFLTAHPEYVDDAQWTALVSHLTFKGPELTHDEVVDRMEAALLEHKRSTGKLEEHLKSEHERGVREGRIQEATGSGHGTGASGDKNEGGKGAGTPLTPKGEEMARAMHTDPAKVAQVDPSKDNVIDVTKV